MKGRTSDRESFEEEEEKVIPLIDRMGCNIFFTLLILLNALFLGVDTQMRAGAGTDGPGVASLIIELAFFVAFLIESVLRYRAAGRKEFWKDSWNVIDLAFVLISMVDVSAELMNLSAKDGFMGALGKLRALRLTKILRVSRLLRLFRALRYRRALRISRGLALVIQAILGTLKPLGWVIGLLVMVTFMFGIVTTEFIGFSQYSEGDADILEWFGDLWNSMFTLFQLSTFAEWTKITRHVSGIHGDSWRVFFLFYVFLTNSILLNVVVASLVDQFIHLSTQIRDSEMGVPGDYASWMTTPYSMKDDDGEYGEEDEDADDHAGGGGGSGPAKAAGAPGKGGGGGGGGGESSLSDRLTMQALSEVFDVVATYVGVEGVNQRRLVTERSLKDAIVRPEVMTKLAQACPSTKENDPTKTATTIWAACPKRLDKEGMSRQELAEACLVLNRELSMNHFVVISQALSKMEKHVEHELAHLNKHQRKMNRRFLKLRHRLRKVYHFDGAPRKMVELVNDIKRKQAAGQEQDGDGEDSSISLSSEESDEGEKKF